MNQYGPRLVDQFKAKVGRYYKIIKPLFRVLSGISLEGKDTSFVIRSVKKESKKFFRAKIYSLPEFIRKIDLASTIELQKDELRELLEILPLFLHNIAITRERWCLGKIENHPFDVFIAPERLIKKDGNNADIYRGLHIQTKRLYQYPPRRMALCEWASFFQSIIEEKITPVDFGFNGHIHYYNRILFNEPVGIEELKNVLRKLYVPYNKYVDSMSVSFTLTNPENDVTTMTLGFYPRFYYASIFDLDLEQVRRIYLEEDIVQMMKKVIITKNYEKS